jgi:hypothetical protein
MLLFTHILHLLTCAVCFKFLILFFFKSLVDVIKSLSPKISRVNLCKISMINKHKRVAFTMKSTDKNAPFEGIQ